MATTIKIVEDNTAPPILITCERETVPINLTACTVTITIAKGLTITQASGACTITDAVNGIISYTPVAGDFPDPGTYKGDVKVVYSTGGVEILYEQLKVKARRKIT